MSEQFDEHSMSTFTISTLHKDQYTVITTFSAQP
jgi:hypothetical protein